MDESISQDKEYLQKESNILDLIPYAPQNIYGVSGSTYIPGVIKYKDTKS